MDTDHDKIDELESQLHEYQEERERIKSLMGQIGSTDDSKRGKIYNWVFTILVILLFAFDLIRYVFHIESIPLPPLISIEIGIFLVSIKIIWMIHRQEKSDHFQFWILNSIEYRLNYLSQTVNDIQDQLDKLNK